MSKLPHDPDHYRALIADLREEEDLCLNECAEDIAALLDREEAAIEWPPLAIEHCDEHNA